MEILLAVVLMAVLLLPAGMLRTDRTPWLEPAETLDDEPAARDLPGVEDGLMTLPFVRSRLDALADELAHVDDDPGILARGFRTTVARMAYDALLADESRLTQEATLHVEAIVGFEVLDGTLR